VDAPLAESEVLCPGHTAAGEAEAVTVGWGFTVTFAEAEALHPELLLTVTL